MSRRGKCCCSRQDYQPKLVVCADSKSIVEGQVARFDIAYYEQVPEWYEKELTVFIDVAQVGDFIKDTPSRSMVIPANHAVGPSKLKR